MDDKYRFLESKSVVKLLASNTWSNVSGTYQRANQRLLDQEEMVRDDFLRNVKLTSPMRVRDVIPESRLARYCNSEYREWEECYKDDGKLSIFCSCVNDDQEDQEPWMLPEVEEAFVSLVDSPEIKEVELVQLQETHKCNLPDRFSRFSFYASFSQADQDEAVKDKPLELTAETFEEMILRLKIRSETVKHVWSPYSQAKVPGETEEKQIVKSRFGNTFAVEKRCERDEVSPDWILDKCHVRRMDFSNLQCLSDSIRTLKAHYFHLEKFSRDLEIVPTTRRLYSDVLRESPRDCLPPLVEEPLYSQTESDIQKGWFDEEPVPANCFIGPPPTCSTHTNFYENVHGSNNYSYGNAYFAGNVYCQNTQSMHKEFVYSNFYQHSSLSKQSCTTPTWFAPAPVFASPPLPFLTAQPSRAHQHYPMFYLRAPNAPTYHYAQNPQQWTPQFPSDSQCVGKVKSKPPAVKRYEDKRSNVKPALSTASLGPSRVLRVSSSLSEDLERQALEQYQNSDENLYRELEKQAEEQYDDDPMENDMRYQYHGRR